MKGNHTIKFGGDFRYVHSTGDTNFSSRDTLSFNRNPLRPRSRGQTSILSNLDVGTFQTIQDLPRMLVGATVMQFQAQSFDKSGARQRN